MNILTLTSKADRKNGGDVEGMDKYILYSRIRNSMKVNNHNIWVLYKYVWTDKHFDRSAR